MGEKQGTVKIGTEARQPAQDSWKTLAVFLLGFLIGMGSVWLWFRNQESSPSVPSDTTARQDTENRKDNAASDSDSAAVSAGGVSESAADVSNFINARMQLAGSTASIQSVSLETSGWVVVYEDRLGQPGNALGATRLDAGAHADVTVELLRETAPAETYDVVLHKDNGDRIFNLEDDFPLRDSGGNPVMIKFKTADGSASN